MEVLVIGPKAHRYPVILSLNSPGFHCTHWGQEAWDGFWFCSEFLKTFDNSIKTSFYQIVNIAKIRSIIDSTDAQTLIHAFVSVILITLILYLLVCLKKFLNISN